MIEFRVLEAATEGYPRWATITPYIDGTDLRDLARPVELPSAKAARERKLAGSYAGIEGDEHTRWPGRHFLDAPSNQWFGDGDTRVLACGGCGLPGCWDLLAQVEIRDTTVVWSGFRMGHRDWDLAALGPFEFDREQYERSLQATRR